MGNNPSLYTAASPEEYVDDNLWFSIYIEEDSVCSEEKYNGYLRFPFEDAVSDESGVAVFDPSTREQINNYSRVGGEKWKAGYCWRVSKDGQHLIAKRPSEGAVTFQGIRWAWSLAHPFVDMAGLPKGGGFSVLYDIPIDLQKTLETRQIWFKRGAFNRKNALSGIKGSKWTDNPNSPYGNPNYAKARICEETPKPSYRLRINMIDLGSDQFIGDEVDLSVFLGYDKYKEWYVKRAMSKYWTAPGKKAPEPQETMIQTWLKSLDPTTRSQQLFSTSRCSYDDGNSYWADEICRYGCNGDGSKNNPSLQYCPQIGSVITRPPYPNDYLRSEMGRAYCKQNPGKCEGALNSWCANDAPDTDGKFSNEPFGKASMCACSWGLDIRRKKILEQMPSVQQMLVSSDVFTRQVGERILQSQLAYFTCKDPQCIESSVYKNVEDKTRPCPSDMIQNCITNITVDAGGNITVSKDIASNTQCNQTLQQILGSKEYECIKAGGKIATDAAGNSICCRTQIVDGKCIAEKCPTGQIRVGDRCVDDPTCKGELVNGKCVDKCPIGYKRLPDGSCGTDCAGEYVKGQCVEKCKPGYKRDVEGKCVKVCETGYELVEGECKEICQSGKRDYTGKCIIIKPDPPKPDPNGVSVWTPNIIIAIVVVGVALVFGVILNKKSE